MLVTFRKFGRRSARSVLSASAAFALLLLPAGCQQRISREELGTVDFKADELPGAGKPYTRPEMAVPGVPSQASEVPAPAAADEPQ